MDIQQYYELKTIGAARLEAKDDGFVAKYSRFDQRTGAILSPEKEFFTMAEIEAQREQLVAKRVKLKELIDILDNFKLECQAL